MKKFSTPSLVGVLDAVQINKSILNFFILLGFLFFAYHSKIYANDSVKLNLEATIDPSCSIVRKIDAGEDSELVEIDADSGAITVEFTIDCNSPFKYSLESANGGLVNTGSATVGGNSDSTLSEVNYKTIFTAALEDGDSTELKQICKSSSFASTAASKMCDSGLSFANSGTAVAIDNDASLTIELDGTYDAPLLNGVPLFSGEFKDTLVLTVETPL